MTPAAAEADRRAHAITRWLGADAPDGRTVDPCRRRRRPARAVLRRALELPRRAPTSWRRSSTVSRTPPPIASPARSTRLRARPRRPRQRHRRRRRHRPGRPEERRDATFSAETYQNEYLPDGGTRGRTPSSTVTAHRRPGRRAATPARRPRSSSSTSPARCSRGARCASAKAAATAAIDCLRDGVAVRRHRRHPRGRVRLPAGTALAMAPTRRGARPRRGRSTGSAPAAARRSAAG